MRDSSAGTYFFNEKTLCVYKWETNYCLLLFSDMIIKTNYFFIFRDLLKFTMKCIIGYHIKAFSFLFCTASEVKSIKGGEHEYTEWLQNNEQKKKRRLILCVYMLSQSMKRWRASIHRMIIKQQVKTEQIKRKQIHSVWFVSL